MVIFSNMSRTPQRFFGLHNHTGASPFDGLGEPSDHFKWCMKNGLDGHAITEHGNMNSYPVAQLWAETNNKSAAQPFKYIPGVEMYFHPDLVQWQRDKENAERLKEDAKAAKKALDKAKKNKKTDVAEVLSQSEEVIDVETTNALVIENETESKGKSYNPVNRRHHLVVLPKNQRGLLKLFSAVSFSTMKGFYRFPRIDAKILRETCSTGDIIVSSACLAGLPAFNIFRELEQFSFDDLNQSLMDDPSISERCIAAVGNCYDLMVSCVGKENYYLELQFNKLPSQNLLNRAIIEFAKRNGITDKLIVTCDAHYYNPDIWLERELYKKLGFMNNRDFNPDSLPKSKDELKCELYPKNAQQLWEEYSKIKQGTSFYDDDIVCDAIERTHDIAHKLIETIAPDRSAKYPNKKLVPEGETSFKHLCKLCMEGLKKRGLDNKKEYIDRIKQELSVMKALKNADYFISYQKIMQLAREVTLVGPARGSGGGSLVAYVLYITDIDPLHFELPFERFLTLQRAEAPDIDCVNEYHSVVMADGSTKLASDIVVGDTVKGSDGQPHEITATYIRGLREGEKPLLVWVEAADGTKGCIDVVPMHKFVLQDGNIIRACELTVGHRLMATIPVEVIAVTEYLASGIQYVDITVADNHMFHIVPFDVIEHSDGSLERVTP